jgi:TPR repeat protein
MILRLAILLLALAPLTAQADFKSGLAAYEAGDYAAALREWTPLAEDGMAEAQYNLGLIHHHGRGVAANPALALEWYRKAAEGGYDRAQYRVAEMYEAGTGTAKGKKDLVQARLWFTMAEEQKYLDAKKRRKRVAKAMSPEQIAMADMLVRHKKQAARERKRN